MADTSHPSFPQPADKEARIWRYLDFTKFLSLLETNTLFLARVDALNDPFEGSFPETLRNASFVLEKEVQLPEGQDERGLFKAFRKCVKLSRQRTYVNCWYLSEQESAAMWKLYAKSDEAVAIQTRYSVLCNQLPEEVYVGVVRYIDYEEDNFPDVNAITPFMHKRLSFQHEQEVRALTQKYPDDLQEGCSLFDYKDFHESVSVDVNLDELIERIYVAPFAPQWFFDLVRSVVKRYGLVAEVVQSALQKEPLFDE